VVGQHDLQLLELSLEEANSNCPDEHITKHLRIHCFDASCTNRVGSFYLPISSFPARSATLVPAAFSAIKESRHLSLLEVEKNAPKQHYCTHATSMEKSYDSTGRWLLPLPSGARGGFCFIHLFK
jgi:hypothetical protein